MSSIINVSMSAIQKGLHPIWEDCILIQIQDPGTEFVDSYESFDETYKFQFWDNDSSCTLEQAKEIVNILTTAKELNQNVVVHCHAGICRSGAVTEIGTILGFNETGAYRQPNTHVKSLMLKAAGLSYDEED